MHTTYLGLGTNLGDREAYLKHAVLGLQKIGNVFAFSRIYETEPFGIADQPWFLNAVVGLQTELDPQSLLHACLKIEEENGRVRTVKNGPRTLDIDVLFYDYVVMDSKELVIPHPGVPVRSTVLAPLHDIAPDLVHPVLGQSVAELFSALPEGEQYQIWPNTPEDVLGDSGS